MHMPMPCQSLTWHGIGARNYLLMLSCDRQKKTLAELTARVTGYGFVVNRAYAVI